MPAWRCQGSKSRNSCAELRQQQGLAAKALEFAILTAARSGEVREMPWEGEIAGDAWTVPGRRMKGGKEHKLPLSKPALAVIDTMREVRQNGFVFPGEVGGDGFANYAELAVISSRCPGR